MKIHEQFMREAIKLSIESINKGGGPFGAVIVKDNKIVARGHNRVTIDNDPTLHAEVVAIKAAAKELNNYDLSGCVIYSSCEPCPMCLGAIYWARLDKLFFGNTKQDAKNIDFDDSFIYKEMNLPFKQRAIQMERLLPDEAIKAFRIWAETENKTRY